MTEKKIDIFNKKIPPPPSPPQKKNQLVFFVRVLAQKEHCTEEEKFTANDYVIHI